MTPNPNPNPNPAERETPAGEAMREAVAYLTPHPSTKGPVILDPVRMRAAQAVVASELARLTAERDEARAVEHNLRGQITGAIHGGKARAEAAEAALTTIRAEHAAEIARLRIAFHDAIRRPLGVTPDSGAEFYDARMADQAEARRAAQAKPETTDGI